MVLNNIRGQAMILGVMIFVMTFIASVMLMPVLFDIVDLSRSDLGCEYDNLTTGNAATCVWVDIVPAFFLAVVMASGASFITSKIAGG